MDASENLYNALVEDFGMEGEQVLLDSTFETLALRLSKTT